MPYADTASLPSDVKDRFSTHCAEVWRTTWNDTFGLHHDEGRAFATAELAGQNCKKAGKSMQAVKSSGKDHIEGLAIPFTSDLDGEDFGPDTDLCLDWFGPSGRPVLYDHGLDGAMKTSIIGRQVEYETREEGIWARAQLDQAAKYRKTIDRLVAEGALGFSSGAIDHLTTYAGKHITRWPWMELSLTTFPAHPETTVYAVKASTAVEHLRAVDIDVPEPLAAALKALDDWASIRDAAPVPEPFTDHIVRVSDDTRGLTSHAREYADMRVKAGRNISPATFGLMRTVSQSGRVGVAAYLQALDEFDAFLAENDPDAPAKRLRAELDVALLSAHRVLVDTL